MKIFAALSMPTISSRGACSTRRAAPRRGKASASDASAMSSRNCLRISKGRPPRSTSADPFAWISSSFAPKLCVTCEGSIGAAMVTTARSEAICGAAFSAAAPPSEWPIRSCGGMPCVSIQATAARRSPTFEVKFVLANSPAECPRPVKSKRSTAMPRAASRPAMRRAAAMSLEQVKQWTRIAAARTGPSGLSSRAASSSPRAPAKVIFSLCTSLFSVKGARCPVASISGDLTAFGAQDRVRG